MDSEIRFSASICYLLVCCREKTNGHEALIQEQRANATDYSTTQMKSDAVEDLVKKLATVRMDSSIDGMSEKELLEKLDHIDEKSKSVDSEGKNASASASASEKPSKTKSSNANSCRKSRKGILKLTRVNKITDGELEEFYESLMDKKRFISVSHLPMHIIVEHRSRESAVQVVSLITASVLVRSSPPPLITRRQTTLYQGVYDKSTG